MAIFTFDDLNKMEHDESQFFGPSNEQQMSEEFAPSSKSLKLIRDYSRSISFRKSATLGNVKLHLN